MKDLRQSENWSSYLGFLGWETEKINDNFIYCKKLGFTTLVKVQRISTLTDEIVKKIEEISKKRNALFIKVETSQQSDKKLLFDNGFEINSFPLLPPSTIVIDLEKPLENLWKDLKKDARYLVRKGEKDGLRTEFHVNPSLDIQKKFWDNLSATGKEKKFYVQPFSDLNVKIKAFGDNSIITLTYKDDKLLSGTLNLLFDNNAFFIHSGTSKEGRKLNAAYFQIWDIIKQLKKMGIKKLDLEGIADDRYQSFTHNWLGFTFFKKKFGGEIIQFPGPLVKLYNPVLITLNKALGSLPL